MFKNKKPFLYNFRMYMFGQQYTKKERFEIGLSIIILNASFGIAIPIIMQLTGGGWDDKVSFTELLLMIFYMCAYGIPAYVIILHIIKFITNATLALYQYMKYKLTARK